MIYYLLYELLYIHFRDKDWYLVKALNVFQYVTFRTAYATITALLISLFFGGKLIEALKQWNVGQQIREEGPQGAPGQARHANDGRSADRRFGFDLDSPVGATLQCLCLDGNDRDVALCGHRFCRRLLEDGEADEVWVDRQAEVAGAVVDRGRCLGSAFHGNEVHRAGLVIRGISVFRF